LQSVAVKARMVPDSLSPNVVAPAAHAASGLPSSPISALPSGFQNTLNPYAIPIDKWTANAAGGTSQRLKLGFAVMYSLDKKLAISTPITMFDFYGIFVMFCDNLYNNHSVLQNAKNGKFG
jgi:hypothetical protein